MDKFKLLLDKSIVAALIANSVFWLIGFFVGIGNGPEGLETTTGSFIALMIVLIVNVLISAGAATKIILDKKRLPWKTSEKADDMVKMTQELITKANKPKKTTAKKAKKTVARKKKSPM